MIQSWLALIEHPWTCAPSPLRIIFGPGRAQLRGPIYLDERTSSGRPGRSGKCQTRKSTFGRKGSSHSKPAVSKSCYLRERANGHRRENDHWAGGLSWAGSAAGVFAYLASSDALANARSNMAALLCLRARRLLVGPMVQSGKTRATRHRDLHRRLLDRTYQCCVFPSGRRRELSHRTFPGCAFRCRSGDHVEKVSQPLG
jgi:hypothetical protein